MSNYPIAIMSFNRPKYLSRVLISLKLQKDIDLTHARIILFQDGATSPISGRSYAKQSEIDANVSMFKAFFPNGEVCLSDVNLGIAQNFWRAENYIYENIGADIGFFFEDDLELGPFYLKTLMKFSAIALSTPIVGYFAAYGHHRASMRQQISNANRIISMAHNWAFGLTRVQWIKSGPYIAQYLALLEGVEYRDRPNKRIVDLFHSWGCGAPGTSQDVAKTLACYATGSIKINTYLVFGKYIGEVGIHTTPELFLNEGFAGTEVCAQDNFILKQLSDHDITACRNILGKYCMEDVA